MTLRTLHLDTSWGRLRLAGGSRAGDATLILLPQLQLAFDPGRPHRSLPPMKTVVVSHGHLDHIGGLGYWASQRFLNSMGPATLLVPDAIAPQINDLLRIFARLEGGRPYEVTTIGVSESSVHPVRHNMVMRFFRTDHWVPTLGSEIIWRKRRLRPDLAGASQEQIIDLRKKGERVHVEDKIRLFAYCADTGPRLFNWHPRSFEAEVVLLECSFFAEADRQRAERFGHMHLADLMAAAERLACRHLVLLHPSRRHRLREVEELIINELRPAVDCQVHHLMVDWE